MREAAVHPHEWADFLTALGFLTVTAAVAYIGRGWHLNRQDRRRDRESAEAFRRRYQSDLTR